MEAPGLNPAGIGWGLTGATGTAGVVVAVAAVVAEAGVTAVAVDREGVWDISLLPLCKITGSLSTAAQSAGSSAAHRPYISAGRDTHPPES